MLQLRKLTCLEPVLNERPPKEEASAPQQESSPTHCNLGKPAQQPRPSTAQNKLKKKILTSKYQSSELSGIVNLVTKSELECKYEKGKSGCAANHTLQRNEHKNALQAFSLCSPLH